MSAPVLAAPDERIASLVAAMTLDEEIDMVSGWPALVEPAPDTKRPIGVGFVRGVPRLGIPSLTFSDGPAGVRIGEVTTALPAPISLAATFSADEARTYGGVIGRDARARDQDVVFSPMLNTVRTPQAGRNFESFGEDPYLASVLATSEIQGIQ